MFTSAIRQEGIQDILDNAILVYQDYTKQHKTSFINRAVQKVLKEKAPPLHKGREVKVYYAHQEEAKPPTIAIITNYPDGWRESYRTFFVRRLRGYLGIRYSPLKLIVRGRED